MSEIPFDIIPQDNCQYRCRNKRICSFLKIPIFHDSNIRNYGKLKIFTSKTLKLIRFTLSFFGCHTPIGVKLLTRLCLGINHIREHKFKHRFLNRRRLQLY